MQFGRTRYYGAVLGSVSKALARQGLDHVLVPGDPTYSALYAII